VEIVEKSVVSIHASREGRDIFDKSILFNYQVSIHASREGRDTQTWLNEEGCNVSIHASREGRDNIPSGIYQ